MRMFPVVVLVFPMLFAASGVRAADEEAEAAPAPMPAVAADPAQRSRLFEIGGALANDGFKMRDSFWCGRIEPRKSRVLVLNFFGGNSYWICAATSPEVKGWKISLFDSSGAPVPVVDHSEPGLAAVGVTAEATGQYFVRIESTGGPASDFCLVYLFK